MRARERSTSLSSCPSHSSRMQQQLEAPSLLARPRSSAKTSSIEIRSSTSSPSLLPSRSEPLAASTTSTVHRGSRCFSANNHRWATPSPQLRVDTKPHSAISMSTPRVREGTSSLSAGPVLTATAPLRPQSDPTATNVIVSTDNADLRSRSETPKSASRSRMATEPIMFSVKRSGGYREIGVLKSIDSQPVFLHRPSSMAQLPPPPSGKLSIAVQTEGQGVCVYAHHFCIEPNADLLMLKAGKVGRTELTTSETSSMENSMDDCPNEASISVAVRTIVGARPSFATVADDYRDSPPSTSPPQQHMLLSSRSSPQLRRDSTARSETASAKARTANVAVATSSPDRHDRSLTSNFTTAEERQATRNAPGVESGARPYHQRLGPHFGIQTPLLAPLQSNHGSERSTNVEVTHSSGPSVSEMAERKGWQRSIDAAYTIATAAFDGTSSRSRTESSKSYAKEVQVFEAMPKVGPNVEVMPGPVVSSLSTWQKIEEEGATQEVKHVAAAHGRNRSMSYHPTNSSRPAPNVPALLTDLPSALVTYEAPPRLLQGLPTQPERSTFWTPPRVSRFHSTTATRLYTAPHGAKQISPSQSPQQQQQQQVSSTSVSRRRQGAIWGDERAHRHHVSVPLVSRGEAATEGIECNSGSQLLRATQKRNEKLVQTIPAGSADYEADHDGEQDRFVHIQRTEGGPAAGVRAPSPSSKSVRTHKLSTAKSFSSVVRSALFRTPRRNKDGNDDGRSSSSTQEGKLPPSQVTPMLSRHGSDQNLSGDTVIYQGPQMSTASFSSRRSSLGKETDTSSNRSVLSAAMRRSSVDKDNAALAHKGPTNAMGYASMQHPPSANKVFSALKGSRLKSRASGVSFSDSSDSLLASSTMMSSSSGGPSGIAACSSTGRPLSPHSSSSQSAPSDEFSPVGVLPAAAAAAPHHHSVPGSNLRQHRAALSILTHSGSTQIAERALESSTSLLSLKRTKRSGPPLQAPPNDSLLYTPRRAQDALPSSPLLTPLMSTTISTMEKSVSFALDNTVVFELQPDPSATETTPRGSGSYPRGMGPSVPIVQNRRSSSGAKSYSSTSSATTHSSLNAVPAGALPNGGGGGSAKQPSTGVNQPRPSVLASSRTSTSTSASTSTSSSARPTLPPTPQTTSRDREREREREKKGPNVKPPSMYLQAHLDAYKGTMPLPGSDEEDSDFEDEDRRVNFAGLGVSGLWTSKKKAEAEKKRRKSNGSFNYPKGGRGEEEVESHEDNEGEGVVKLDDIVASGPQHKGSRKR